MVLLLFNVWQRYFPSIPFQTNINAKQISAPNISILSYSGYRLTWMNALRSCPILLFFPTFFIQSVHFWPADLKHDNGSGLVNYQHASAAVPFHLLVPFLTDTHLGDAPRYRRMFNTFITENRLHTESVFHYFIILSFTVWRSALCSSCKGQRQAFQLFPQIFTHPQSLLAYTCKWQIHAAQLPHSCRGW